MIRGLVGAFLRDERRDVLLGGVVLERLLRGLVVRLVVPPRVVVFLRERDEVVDFFRAIIKKNGNSSNVPENYYSMVMV